MLSLIHILEKSKATSAITDADLPLYPVMVYDAKLENISSMNANGQTKHVPVSYTHLDVYKRQSMDKA